jgi:hypothetical protein
MVDRESLYAGINSGILEERIGSFTRNLEKNIPLIKKWGGLRDTAASMRGRNIIIAGAGPSLDMAMPYLKKYQYRNNLGIIATDMAFRPLMKRGIVPSWVITCETTPVPYFCGLDTGSSTLLAFSCASNSNIRSWKGAMAFFNWMIDGPEYSPLWDRAGLDLGSLATGSVVTTNAVSLALGSGIESLMMCGNDLGYKESYYCRGTIRQVQAAALSKRFSGQDTSELRAVSRRKLYRVERGGNLFFTDNQFLTAKLWLEELFAKQQLPVFDCSEPGCAGKGVNRVPLEQYFSRYDRKRNGRRK